MKQREFSIAKISGHLGRTTNGVSDRWKNYLKNLDKKSLEYISKMSKVNPDGFLVFSTNDKGELMTNECSIIH
jgi:hypothetical protein